MSFPRYFLLVHRFTSLPYIPSADVFKSILDELTTYNIISIPRYFQVLSSVSSDDYLNSLVSRPFPVFQCCMHIEKLGRA